MSTVSICKQHAAHNCHYKHHHRSITMKQTRPNQIWHTVTTLCLLAYISNESFSSPVILPTEVDSNQTFTYDVAPTSGNSSWLLVTVTSPTTFAPGNRTTSAIICASDEFQCGHSTECIPNIWTCDYKLDCSDGSDELGHFTDQDESGYPFSGELFGDEALKHEKHWCEPCGVQYFRCNQNNECIPRGWLCDGQIDCGPNDNSDESNELCASNNQEHVLTIDQTVAADNDTLLPDPHVVVYNLTHLIGLVRLFSNVSDVYHWSPSSLHQEIEYSLLLSATREQKLCWLDKTNISINCISMLPLLMASVKSLNSSTSANKSQITPVQMSHKIPSFIEASSISRIVQDWLTDNWYLLDAPNELLYLCSSSFQHCLVVADQTVLSRPLSLDVDAEEGLLFFSRRGDKSGSSKFMNGPAIVKANLDGSQVTTVADIRLLEPSYLALDVANRRIYWIDTKLDLLEYVDYNGDNRHIVKEKGANSFNGWLNTLALYAHENRVYIVARKRRNLSSKRKRNDSISTSDTTSFQSSLMFSTLYLTQNTSSKQMYHSWNQFENVSIVHNVIFSTRSKSIRLLCAKCQNELCIPKFDYEHHQMISAECFAKQNQTTAQTTDIMFLYSRGDPGLIKTAISSTPQAEGNHILTRYPHYPIPFSKCPTSFDVDSNSESIYYIDDCSSTLIIHNIFMKANDTNIIKIKLTSYGINRVETVAVDSIGDNIYLVDSEAGAIFVLTIRKNKTLVRTIVDNLDKPKALSLDISNGIMFYSEYGSALLNTESEEDNLESASIKRANMDGSQQKTIVNSNSPLIKFPNALTVDPSKQELYWCDTFFKRIEVINYNGQERRLLLQSARIGIATSLFFYRNFLYWTELQHGTLQHFNLETNISAIILQEKAPLYQVKIIRKTFSNYSYKNIKSSDCEQFKLLNKNKPEFNCFCADEYSLNEDKKSCNQLSTQELTEKFCVNPIEEIYCIASRTCLFRRNTNGSCERNSNLNCTINKNQSFSDNLLKCGLVQCDIKQFSCDQNKRCIPYHWLCDGHKDCHDRSDEEPSMSCYHHSNCPSNQFRCKTRKLCIPMQWRCDGELDCGPGDFSDETGCK